MVAWIILLTPFAACITITLLTLKHKKLSGLLAIGALLLSFILTLYLFIQFLFHPETYESMIPWISLWEVQIHLGILIDSLSLLMLLVVTGVGSAIFIYSYSYMSTEPGFSRYFATLSLFAFSMLGIILSNNFIQIFIFWELVGASSYLLIGFWFDKDSAADAGNKAFLVNRVGDFGLLIGILLLWVLSGTAITERTFNFGLLSELIPALAQTGVINPTLLALIGLLIFCGILGKSAQFPLHVWLPDAMEGPTPVSALIHAATMVAAGVYLLARAFFLFSTSAVALTCIAYIGAFTAIFAATIALVQNDIKRILAYSTLSQLGYMVMAMGLGGTTAGMYHLTTHAFFKALLFLSAGAMIHALHTQNIWKMGNLLKRMPVTSITFLIGTLALCGIPPLSGFWSKDEVLYVALNSNFLLFLIGVITAGLTALYMGRLCFIAILGPSRSDQHVHEAPLLIKIPLMCLAFFSLFAGFMGIPLFLDHHAHFIHLDLHVALPTTCAVLLGLAISYFVYAKAIISPTSLKKIFTIPHQILSRKYYIDEFYAFLLKYVQQSFAQFLDCVDRVLLMSLWVNGLARITQISGEILKFSQTGRLQTYALFLLAGVTLIIYVVVLK